LVASAASSLTERDKTGKQMGINNGVGATVNIYDLNSLGGSLSIENNYEFIRLYTKISTVLLH